LAYYQIFSGENDKIRGTDDDDTVLGPAGGTDQIDTRGGDDVVTIYQRAIYSILATPIGDFLDQYLGLADPFTGTIDGGEGVDTLVARIIPKAGVRILDPYDLSKAIVRDVEILRTEDPVALTIAQTAWFQFLRGYSTQLYIELVGEGGALDLSIKSDEALVSEVDGAALTSALRYVGTHRSDIVTGSAFGDVLFGGSGDDEVRWLGGVDYLSGGSGRDTLTIIWSETTRLDFDGSTYSGTLANGTKYVGFEQFKVRGGDGDDEITGGGGSDRLTGGNGSNVIRGLGGDDIIGLDFGYYDDTDLQLLTFHPGKDRLYGDGGNDMIHASGNDFVDGGTGDDELSSSFGGNRLFGGSGNDRLSSSGTTQSFQPPVVVDELFGESGE
jgi:Ca2+-binding RTX toxin-like protein